MIFSNEMATEPFFININSLKSKFETLSLLSYKVTKLVCSSNNGFNIICDIITLKKKLLKVIISTLKREERRPRQGRARGRINCNFPKD